MNRPLSTLIVDDDEAFVDSLSDFLSGKGFFVLSGKTGAEGVERFEKHQPPLVLLDQNLPDMEGIQVCRKILEINPTVKVIFITAFATVRYAVDAMEAGAFNYLSKPFDLNELLITMDRAVKSVHMEGKLKVRDYEKKREREEKRLIGSSLVLKRIREQIMMAADTEANVLITGETGVGKNVVARAIHDLQAQREDFLTINCTAIPENLMEAECFGHEKGVFTGADACREGIFELADGGTLVLDEIGDIPIQLQSKLLSVLEDKSVRRIGGGRNIPIDIRIIATTNQELEEAIRNKRFRQDLYYRLAVFSLRIPPLREHPEDIPEIADYFVEKFCGRPVKIPEDDIKKMTAYPWPGNVRELRNVIERASILLGGDEIRPADLLVMPGGGQGDPERVASPNAFREILPLEAIQRRYIFSSLEACSGNKSRTARALGISISTLKRKLKEMNMKTP